MWALRRASGPFRNRAFSIRASSASLLDLELPVTYIQDKAGMFYSSELTSDRYMSSKGFYWRKHPSVDVFLVRRSLSSQASGKSSEDEDDLEDGFSELEILDSAKIVHEKNAEDENEGELISTPHFFDDDDEEEEGDAKTSKSEMEILDIEADLIEEMPSGKDSALFQAIVASPGLLVRNSLDKWIQEGNDLEHGEIYSTICKLRGARMYGRALQFSEWLEASKQIEFVERDYAFRLDLIAKLHGLERAEYYIEKIPETFRGELIYLTILSKYVRVNNVKKAEKVFKKMKDLDLPLTVSAYNKLLLLYKRNDKRKIGDLLALMEKENVKPSLLTYKLLMDIKGQFQDISGMEKIFETMKADGIEPDVHTHFVLARCYASAGLKEKAVAVLKEMEDLDLTENRHVCRDLLRIYGELGQADEVKRVWKVCEANPWTGESIAAIQAWGKLENINEAEAIFKKMLKAVKRPSAVHFIPLIKVYADHKMVSKGKDLIKRMADSGCKIRPGTWDLLVRLYVEAGDIEKADAVLKKAGQQEQVRLMMRSYMAVMDQYSKRGDVHNTEKIFHRMREAGYSARLFQFQTLVQAYVNAKVPAYGMMDRMRADNVYANRSFAEKLAQVDAFRKTAASDLLD